MIEPQKQHSCIVCKSTENLTPVVIENETVYICEKCDALTEALIDRIDPTPF